MAFDLGPTFEHAVLLELEFLRPTDQGEGRLIRLPRGGFKSGMPGLEAILAPGHHGFKITNPALPIEQLLTELGNGMPMLGTGFFKQGLAVTDLLGFRAEFVPESIECLT
jgi:hypothetical protein